MNRLTEVITGVLGLLMFWIFLLCFAKETPWIFQNVYLFYCCYMGFRFHRMSKNKKV